MALSRDQKKAQVAELSDKLSKAQSVIFAHYIGLSVAEVSDLRNKLRESDAEMKVAKKTLMKIAAKESGMPELKDETMDGPVACIFSFADPLTGAQIAFKFGKDHKQVELIGGIFDGKVLSKEQAAAFAQMPTRDEQLAKFVGMIRSPLQNFASALQSPLSGFARIAKELAEQGGIPGKEAPAAEAPAPAAEEKTEESAPTTEDQKADDSASTESTSEEKTSESSASSETSES